MLHNKKSCWYCEILKYKWCVLVGLHDLTNFKNKKTPAI